MPFLHDDLFVDMFTGPFSQSPAVSDAPSEGAQWKTLHLARGLRLETRRLERGWTIHSCKKAVDNRQRFKT